MDDAAKREWLLLGDVIDKDDEDGSLYVNLNDTFGWACADGETVTDADIPRLYELFWHYGWCGVLYWATTKQDRGRSEFQDINRFIDFVRHEEAIRAEFPASTKRAYAKKTYTLGEHHAD